MAASVRHETRALLRAHLAAASSYRHLTRHCPICHRLMRLAMDSSPLMAPNDSETSLGALGEAMGALEAVWEDEQPSTA
ncbi:DUF6274 family protein [Streptomyces carpinensis]|uniref:DUF6274 family protein n=1 Tax=Streptomyces carpinensis TaxID=66369 RepID=A0ABV1VVA6_9ACTN|nr:DUF6274 family protein [Streptomyces carpinensis]